MIHERVRSNLDSRERCLVYARQPSEANGRRRIQIVGTKRSVLDESSKRKCRLDRAATLTIASGMNTTACSGDLGILTHTIYEQQYRFWFEINISIESQNKRILSLNLHRFNILHCAPAIVLSYRNLSILWQAFQEITESNEFWIRPSFVLRRILGAALLSAQ